MKHLLRLFHGTVLAAVLVAMNFIMAMGLGAVVWGLWTLGSMLPIWVWPTVAAALLAYLMGFELEQK